MIAPPPQAIDIAPAAAVYADALLREAVAVTEADVWHSPGESPDVYVYTGPPGFVAWGGFTVNEIYFNRRYRDDWWRRYSDAHAPLEDRRGALEELCVAAAHEEGHNRGLPHISGTLMAPVLPRFPDNRGDTDPAFSVEPVACKRWARVKLVDRRAMRARESRAARGSASIPAARVRYGRSLARLALG